MRTVADLLTEARASLSAAGVETPDLDARLLVGAALRMTTLALATDPYRQVGDTEAAVLAESLARRRNGEPVDRILGYREFWGLRLALGPATLAPRPDTETLVEAALAAFTGRSAPRRVLDLGVGTGALLLALLHEWPMATGLGIDLSLEAVAVARENAVANGLDERTTFQAGDWGAGVDERFDLVVSNPPYIPTNVVPGLAREVRLHDPLLALDGGPDGLAAYRAILGQATRLLHVDGLLILELGHGQEDAVARLAVAAGLRPIGAARRDLAGVPRAFIAARDPAAVAADQSTDG